MPPAAVCATAGSFCPGRSAGWLAGWQAGWWPAASCRPAAGQQQASCRPAAGQQQASCRPAAGQLQASSRPAQHKAPAPLTVVCPVHGGVLPKVGVLLAEVAGGLAAGQHPDRVLVAPGVQGRRGTEAGRRSARRGGQRGGPAAAAAPKAGAAQRGCRRRAHQPFLAHSLHMPSSSVHTKLSRVSTSTSMSEPMACLSDSHMSQDTCSGGAAGVGAVGSCGCSGGSGGAVQRSALVWHICAADVRLRGCAGAGAGAGAGAVDAGRQQAARLTTARLAAACTSPRPAPCTAAG